MISQPFTNIVQPLCCDQFESFDIDRLPKDPLFLADFIVSKDHGDLCGICIDTTREAYLVLSSEGANEIERNMEAVHCVSLVVCCLRVWIVSQLLC